MEIWLRLILRKPIQEHLRKKTIFRNTKMQNLYADMCFLEFLGLSDWTQSF